MANSDCYCMSKRFYKEMEEAKMVRKKKVLFIGETWMVHTVEAKGFDIFTADSYGTGTEYIKKALDTDEIEFHHIPWQSAHISCHPGVPENNWPWPMLSLI